MAYKIEDIEGIGQSYASKLATAKIMTTEDLLEHCGTPKGRKAIAEKTGIGESTILKWLNMADLMRISGVGSQYSELLNAAGVDTVKELATRKAENLAAKMGEVNAQKKLANKAPSATEVEKWVIQAKKLDPRISY
jgi:predicted flap endonuclease-1-like 5' DNA nuclease